MMKLFQRIKEKNQEAEAIIQELRQNNVVFKRRLIFVCFFIGLVLLLIMFIPSDSSVVMILQNSPIINVLDWISIKNPLMNIFCLSFFGFLLFSAMWIRKKHRQKFSALKRLNYSSWTFKPKDIRKFVFISVYSLLFILIIRFGLGTLY
ncbi:MAG: hypothetical protein GF332_01505 [Candidatus Moranbacteria bacterium]|nr:hypothetical protein [Candidatus Moranbacteria bacterium]